MDSQDASNLSLLAVLVLLVLGGLIWSLPRRFAICPLLAMVGLMPMGQQLELFGLHFYLFRILLLVGLGRVITRGEAARMNWTRTDKWFACWIAASVVFGSLSKPSTELLISRLGEAYNAVGCYFFVRCVLLDFDDVATSVRTLAYLSLPVAVLMLVERSTTHNPFAALGGVPEISPMRDGHVRAQGAFRHAILAGTFGATLFPLCVALWIYERRSRWLAVAGIIASLVIVVTASSSGALMAAAGAGGALALWKIRYQMKWVRRGTIALFIALAMIMKAPVWYIFARVSDIAGGGGWHRAYVIDQAVNHFDEWWLFGTTYTAHWAPAGEVIAEDPNMMDITNQFVMEGVKGGILKLALFVAVITACFRTVGKGIRMLDDGGAAGFLMWAAGASLFAHCLSFMSVPYFDQIIIVWYWLLAAIVCMGSQAADEETQDNAAEAESAEERDEETVDAGVSLPGSPLVFAVS